MKIAFVASEVYPYAKAGGLADVAGALPKELAKLGHQVKVFMPKYYSVNEYEYDLHYDQYIGEMKIRIGGHPQSTHVFHGFLPDSDVDIYFIHNPHYFHRHQIYTDDWDEDERFILFQKGVIEALQRMAWAPDIIHCNDWQTALIPLFIKDNYSWDKLFENTATLLTIHNIGYQGRFSPETLGRAEINGRYFYPGGPVETDGGVNFLKTGIFFADMLNTVSPTYAKELLTPEFGAGLENYLQQRQNDFVGILNGVDYSIWNPETDKHIPYHYSIKDTSNKIKNKEFLLKQFNLSFDPDTPLIGIVSRLVPQKGFDIIADAINDLMSIKAQWIILGSGEKKYEDLFNAMRKYFPDKVGVYIGYNNELAHLIEAGADIFLMPSHYEPCGLNQIYSLKYGTVPVVRKTGGLADTVQDWNEYNSYGLDIGNGFSFYEYSGSALFHSVLRAINDFHNKPVWKKIQYNGMIKDYSWHHSAQEYNALYQRTFRK